jgi:hypothetical protein
MTAPAIPLAPSRSPSTSQARMVPVSGSSRDSSAASSPMAVIRAQAARPAVHAGHANPARRAGPNSFDAQLDGVTMPYSWIFR